MFARVSTRSFASRFESGSSIRNTLGSRTIARPIATRWRWPPDSALGLRSRYGSRSSSAAVSRTFGLALRFGHVAQLEREAHVVGDGHMRVERVVLEHHRDVAVLGRSLRDVGPADPDLAAGHVLEAGEHAQGGRLAGARGPDEDHELAVLDLAG